MANGKVELTLEQLWRVLAGCTHEVPGDCWATGPFTGDAINDLVVCPGCAARRIIAAAIAEAEREAKKLVVEVRLEPFADDDYIMTAKEFAEACATNSLTNDDGTGYAATAAGMFRGIVVDCRWPKLPKPFTHVVWFNK